MASSPGPPVSISDQINRLSQRGLSIPDTHEAARFLNNVNLYRFQGYLEPFVDQTVQGNHRPFLPNTSFSTVVDRYDFDARLRTLLLEAFNCIEVSIRTQWTYHLAYTEGGGEFAHLDPNLFSQGHSANLAGLQQEYQQHGKATHRYDFGSCPIWAIVEVMSLGQLSRWYGDSKREVRRHIAGHYQVDERILQSVLRHLAPIRNFCAHHERLWDRVFITKMKVPTRLGTFSKPRELFNPPENGRIYNTLVMIAYLTWVITDKTEWANSLVALMNQHQNIPRDRMGFVAEWQKLDIWLG